MPANGWFNNSKVDSREEKYPCSNKNIYIRVANTGNRCDVFNISGDGSFFNTSACYYGGVRPVFFITSNINLDGKGTTIVHL